MSIVHGLFCVHGLRHDLVCFVATGMSIYQHYLKLAFSYIHLIVMFFLFVYCFEMRGGCSFCIYWWNCWPSLSFLCSLIWGERYLYFYVDTGGLIDHHCLFFVHVPSQDLDFQCQRSWSFIAFIILRSEVFVPCFYWWKITNGLPLLFSFHNTYKWWYILWIY